MRTKVTSAHDAIERIRPRDTLCVSGFVGTGTPEELIRALETRYLKTQAPFDLTLVFAAAPGDGRDRGVNRFAHPGLLKRVIGGHWALVPKLGELALNDEIEAYNLPLGVMSELFREIAGNRCGVLSKIGLGTFVDPRQSGGRLNPRTWESLVDLMCIDDEEWLLYKKFPIDVAFIRGTTADSFGNISMEREALTLDNLAIATAARNSGGVVIAQVEQFSSKPLSPRAVEVPGVLVDHVVIAAQENHSQTWATAFNPAFAGLSRTDLTAQEPMPLDARKVIARRAAMELVQHSVINLGIGMPEGVARVAGEEGMIEDLTLTAEPGVIGGMPQGGLDFGAALNHNALLHQNEQFDFYDGGGLDLAILGMAEVDEFGHVNVSKFGTKLAGAGGFINISQTAKRVVFVGTFSTGGLKIEIKDQRLVILEEGEVTKFVNHVEQITFNGERAACDKRSVLYVTERCVFKLTPDGLELIEVAPGLNMQTQILDLLPFDIKVTAPAVMDERLFRPEVMGLWQKDELTRRRRARTLDGGEDPLAVVA